MQFTAGKLWNAAIGAFGYSVLGLGIDDDPPSPLPPIRQERPQTHACAHPPTWLGRPSSGSVPSQPAHHAAVALTPNPTPPLRSRPTGRSAPTPTPFRPPGKGDLTVGALQALPPALQPQPAHQAAVARSPRPPGGPAPTTDRPPGGDVSTHDLPFESPFSLETAAALRPHPPPPLIGRTDRDSDDLRSRAAASPPQR